MLSIADPLFDPLVGFGTPISNGKFTLNLPLFSTAHPIFAGTYLGFEVALFDVSTLSLVDTTQSVWVLN